MNKSNHTKSAVSVTSPKGTLIAQINNLRKQLKDIKQSKKQSHVLTQKSLKQFSSILNKKHSKQKQKCVTSASNVGKDKFFKSSKQEFYTIPNSNGNSNNGMKSSNLIFQTEKSFQISDKKQKNNIIDQISSHKKQKKSSNINKSLMQKIIVEEDEPLQNNNASSEIFLSEILVKEKDKKLKLDIELNKLKKIFKKSYTVHQVFNQFNHIVSVINGVMRQYSGKIQYLEKNQKDDCQEQILLIKRQEDQINHLTQKIIELENQNKQFRQKINIKEFNDKEIQKITQLNTHEKQQLLSHTQNLQNSIKQLQQHSITLQQQNRILQSKLLKKQQQLILLNQDIKYLRLQTQNYKQLKQQHLQLYESTLQEYRDYKRTKNLQIQKLISQKQKWENQCKMRRNQSEEIKSLEEEKIILMKEISQMRYLFNIKNSQLDQKKSIMHQNQKKVITLQSQVYKLKSEIQTVRNQYEYSQFQNQKLRQQLQDIKKYQKRSYQKDRTHMNSRQKLRNNSKQKTNPNELSKKNYKSQLQIQNRQNQQQNDESNESLNEFQSTNVEMKRQKFNKSLKQRQQKLKALDDIHSLIRKHKNQMQL